MEHFSRTSGKPRVFRRKSIAFLCTRFRRNEMSLHLWFAFCAANLLTSLSPGPGAMMAVNAGATHGLSGGLRAIAGLQAALLMQLAVVGMSAGALLATSETAFVLLRGVGAAYLIWLGIMECRIGWQNPATRVTAALLAPKTLFWRGMLVNLSNPKALLFQAALVPQFIDAAKPLTQQYLIIAITMCVIDTLVMSGYSGLASRLASRFASPTLARGRHLAFGMAFVAFGVALLVIPR